MPRQVVARFNRQDYVSHILEQTRTPKGTRYDPLAFRVTPQHPTSMKHVKNKVHDRVKIEKNNYPHVNFRVQGNKLYANDDEVDEKVPQLSTQDKLRMSRADKLKANKLLFHKSRVISENDSDFRIYCTEIPHHR